MSREGFQPLSGEEASAWIVERSKNDEPFQFRGGGTRLVRQDSDLLDTRALREVIFFETEDMVAGLGAGMLFRELRDLLNKHQMMLPVSPWYADATVGGMVAANDFGPERLTGGGLRDAIIGMELIDGMGNIVRAGGKVVKNVTGYDISRLMIGSLGGIGVITAVNVKMMPSLQRPWTLAFRSSGISWLKQVRALHLSKCPIDWLQAICHQGEWCVGVGISGNDERRARLIADVKACLGEDCQAFAEKETPEEFTFFNPDIRQGGFLSPHISRFQSDFFHLHGIFPSNELLNSDWWMPDSLEELTVVAHPVGGDVHWLAPPDREETLLAQMRRGAARRKGYLVIEKSGKSTINLPVILPVPSGYELMCRLKKGLDPKNIFLSAFYDGASTEFS